MKELNQVLEKANSIILGKEKTLELALVTLVCQGHLLLEDIPGVGKTTMVYILGRLLGLDISRIQFTNDLLPSDIIGISIYKKETENFVFHKGPIFGNLILADELNRATPKTQSALLQVMEEKHVSIDNNEFKLENPFIIFATQNPQSQRGTYPLPESQLDRFFMALSLGLPSPDYEKEIIQQRDMKGNIFELGPILTKERLNEISQEVWNIKASDQLLDYVISLLQNTRETVEGGESLSPRAGKDLLLASRGRAYIQGRTYVTPEDVQAVFPNVIGHRISSFHDLSWGVKQGEMVLKRVSC